MHEIIIEEKILAENSRLAAQNRALLRGRGIYSVNLISSPGAGKTSLIEKAAPYLKQAVGGFAVVEGDLATELDAERVARLGVPVRQVKTGRACHLDAHDISHVLAWAGGLDGLRLLVIENVGNMVCPAEYDLGEEMKITVLSATEGDDKPLKYPAIFAASTALVLNKTDLIPYTDFSMGRARENALRINPSLKVFETSCRTGEGVEAFSAFVAGCAAGAAE
ncbi:MAG: hydrogenase nickel incorporation protein HypB [Thermodesulfobacteriota bacterium]